VSRVRWGALLIALVCGGAVLWAMATRSPSALRTEPPAASVIAPTAAGTLDAPPSIVLITIDTLRADHLGTYGHPLETSPNLDAFAEEAVVFERVLSASGTTTPSHLSLLTGLYPHQHGVLGNRAVLRAPFRSAPGTRTVAELLGESGYATAGIVSATPVKAATGMAAGFRDWIEPDKPLWRCDRTASRAVGWLRRQEVEPFFLWVHLWEPHAPNWPDSAHVGPFQRDPTYERLLDERRVDPRRVAVGTSEGMLRRFFVKGKAGPLPEIDRRAMADLLARYDGDVRHVDECVGRVFAQLHATGAWDDAIVVVTSDHGQSLGQHGWLAHNTMSLVGLEVPLMVRFPEGIAEPARYDVVASGVDVMPTVLARFESPASDALLAQAAGEDLLSGSYARDAALGVGESPGPRQEAPANWTLRVGDWKLQQRVGSPPRLFDLTVDPLELTDVARQHPERVERMKERAEALLSDRPRAISWGEEVTPELAAELEALGYIGE